MIQYVQKKIREYSINFFIKNNDDLLSIIIQNKQKNGEIFVNTQLQFKKNFKESFLNYEDFLFQLNEGKDILIDLKEVHLNEGRRPIKYLILKLKKKFRNEFVDLISKKIYVYNIEYYLTKGPNNERVNVKPYATYI